MWVDERKAALLLGWRDMEYRRRGTGVRKIKSKRD